MQKLFGGKEYNIEKTESQTEEEKKLTRMQERMHGDNKKEQEKARRFRIYAQIDYVVEQGQDYYFFKEEDKEIIEDYIKENGNCIEFVMEK